jgi:putative membrane protein
MDRKFLQTLGAALAAGVFLSAGAFAQNNPNPNAGSAGMTTHMSSADQKFVRSAASGGMAEVQLGQLATQNASSDQVKQFGQRMVTDHSKANDELKSLAARQNITLPTDLDAKDKATLDRLQNLKGAAFDRAYMRDMVKDHETDVAEFQKESTGGTDPQLKEWAGKTLPTLQDHLKMARETDSSVGKSSSR